MHIRVERLQFYGYFFVVELCPFDGGAGGKGRRQIDLERLSDDREFDVQLAGLPADFPRDPRLSDAVELELQRGPVRGQVGNEAERTLKGIAAQAQQPAHP